MFTVSTPYEGLREDSIVLMIVGDCSFSDSSTCDRVFFLSDSMKASPELSSGLDSPDMLRVRHWN